MSHILGMHANTTGMARQRIAIRSSGRPARHARNQKAAVYASRRISPCHGATQAQHGHPAVAILQSQPVLQPRRRRTSCAASGTISDTAAAVQHPPLQVTRSNFAASLPAIKQALQQCQFFSFDCEMTGLYLPNQDDHAADDVDDRYVKAAAAAEQFLVAQFGLSFFEWTGSSYEVRSFNFYLFPSTNGDIDVRFMSQVSALAFLASEGFDFNKMIYEGIPFLPLSWRDKQLRQSAAAAAAVNVNDLDEDELIYMQHLEEQISDWLAAAAAAGGRAGSSAAASAAAADVLYLTAPPPQFAKLQQRLLAAGIGSSRWPGSSSTSSDVELLYIIDQPAAGQISRGSSDSSVMLRVATAQQVAEDAQFRAAHRAEQLALMTGFSQIFELIRDSQKPGVGHNVRFDLAYTLASFIQRPLPKTWSEFKNLVGKWFPGGVYDTKYLAHCLKFGAAAGGGRLLLDSSLGGCYSAMTPSDPAAPQPLGSSSSSTVSISNLSAWIEEKTQPLDDPHLWQTLPQVVHAPGCEAYAAAAAAAAGSSNSNSSSISSAHEAGYDAFMTGVVFIGLMRLFEIEGVAQTSRWQQPVQPSGPPGLENVEQYTWRQFFSKSKAIEYAALQGPEMVPNKPEVLYLTKFAQGTKWQDIQKRVQQLGLGRPPVSFVRANGMNNQPTGAYVIFQNGKQAQKALQAIRANNSWKVQAMTYNDYFFSKHGSSNSSASEVVRARPAAVAAAAAATPAEEAGAPGKLVQQLQQKTAVARHRQQQRVEEQQQQNELLAFVMSSIEEAEAASSSGGDGQPDVAAAATNTGASPAAAAAGSSSGKAAAAAALLAERQRRLAQLQQQQLRQVHAASTPAAAGPVLRRPPAPPRQ